ncbi:MAG: macro domain-containing protein [Candidatus Bathyarchaeia archaeon]
MSLRTCICNTVLEIVKGDITELCVDAIVNAANNKLKLGGGVAAAIHRRGGPIIQNECDKIILEKGKLSTGEAAITSAGKLKAKHVIHAVGPIYGEGNEEMKLRNAIINSLEIAEKYNLKSIAFPAISTGHFGMPKEKCAKIMFPSIISYIKKGTTLSRVIICLYDQETYDIFEKTLKQILKA